MYTIISGTNRPGSHSEKVAIEYKRLLEEKNVESIVFDLKDIDVLKKNAVFAAIEINLLAPATKFIFIIYIGRSVNNALLISADHKLYCFLLKIFLKGCQSVSFAMQ